MPSYKVTHLTRYSYAAPVIDCTNQLMLYPLEDERLTVKTHDVVVSQEASIEQFTDYFGNQVGVFSVLAPHQELTIESRAEVTTHPIQFPMDEEEAAVQWQNLAALHHEATFIDFLVQEHFPSGEDMRQVLRQVIDPAADKPLKTALKLSEYVYDTFSYQQGVTNIETPADEIWRLKAGVCQDFAHILLCMLRQVGIPARYVSGYICPKEEGVRGEGATHAWVEAYIPFYGWLGLDPTNNCIVNDGHIRLAVGRHFSDCTPVKGTYKGSGAHKLEVAVHVENGQPRQPRQPSQVPTYSYEVPDPEVPVNSYQRYLQMQQQQQQ